MTFHMKRDHLKNFDLQPISELPMNNIDNDDEQDIYISERSSIASSNDIIQTPNALIKRLPTPTPSPPVSSPPKPSYISLRCHHTELLENGIPVANQAQLQHKEDKRKKKTLRKRPSGQANVVSFSETKPSEFADNHYPYYYQHKNKTSDRTIRHRQTNDVQLISNESVESLQTASMKPRQQKPRKSRQNGAPVIQSTLDKQRHDHMEKNSSPSTYVSSHEHYDYHHPHQGPSTKQCIPLKNDDDDDYHEQSFKPTKSQQRRKVKPENDWPDHYVSSLRNKSPQDSNSLIITSTSLANRPKNRSKMPDKNLLTTDYDEDGRHRRQSHQPQNQIQSYHSPSILSSQNNNNHRHHPHIRRRPPSGAYLGSDFQVMDVSFKKPERSPYFHQPRDSFHSPSPPIYHQNPSLPPIIRDHHQHKTKTSRFPTEYYGTLARQPHPKDWEQPVEISKLYKPDSQTRFYDRYLTNTVDKRLVA